MLENTSDHGAIGVDENPNPAHPKPFFGVGNMQQRNVLVLILTASLRGFNTAQKGQPNRAGSKKSRDPMCIVTLRMHEF